MNKSELKDILVKEQFRSNSYSLDNNYTDEALCLRQVGDQWAVFYSERGLETGKRHFQSEHEACEYFLDEMRSDPTTRKSWSSGWSMK